MYYLYKIANTANDKLYIGITNNPKLRWQQHLSARSNCTKLKRALNKYGPENFRMEVICIGEEGYIIDLESKAITAYDSVNNGYNLMHSSDRESMSHHEESKKRTSESLKEFYRENQNPLKGTKVLQRTDDKPVYAKGFWFPNTRTCQEAMGISDALFYKWKKQGTLGDTQRLRKDSAEVPTYVAGFWFDTLTRACDSLNQQRKTLRKRIKDSNVEQQDSRRGKFGEANHMTGKKGFAHHKSIAVEINGVIYGSISLASEQTEFTKKMIYTRLKNNTPGFAWV
jgi:group I intron endonuclease